MELLDLTVGWNSRMELRDGTGRWNCGVKLWEETVG